MVLASQMLGLAFFKANMYPQCYSLFGGERRGAPVVSFLRVDKQRILLKCDIKHPSELIYFDEGLVNPEEIKSRARPGSRILLNTNRSGKYLEELSDFVVGCIDANAIAYKVGLGHVINTTVLGAYCRFTGHFPLQNLLEAAGEKVPAKIERNIEAMREGYDKLKLYGAEK